MSINPRTKKTYLNEDQTWIGPGGLADWKLNQSVVLDRSLFDLVGDFSNGFVPSGVVLGEVTAAGPNKGMYGPYDPAAADGRETAKGFLAVTVTMSREGAAGDDELAALYIRGVIDESELPDHHGLDAAAKADLAAKFTFV